MDFLKPLGFLDLFSAYLSFKVKGFVSIPAVVMGRSAGGK